MIEFTIEEEIRRVRDELFHLEIDVAIRVEGIDDKPFWESIFTIVQPDLKYRIFTEAKVHPSPGASGKEALLQFANHTSKEFILCIDSDYDYLLDDEIIKTNPFILQTYADSIENFWCNPKHLKDLCCKAAAVDEIDFDFEVFFSQLSEIIYELFLISIKEESTNQEESFDRKALGLFINLEGVINSADNGTEVLYELAKKVQTERKKHRLYKATIESVETKLKNFGISKNEISWLIRGKNIYSITHLLVKSVVNNAINQKRQEIASEFEGEEIQNQIEKHHVLSKTVGRLINHNHRGFNRQHTLLPPNSNRHTTHFPKPNVDT